MKAIDQLRKEHAAVKLAFGKLDRICKNFEDGQKVDAAHLEELFRDFERLEKEKIGPGKHEALH